LTKKEVESFVKAYDFVPLLSAAEMDKSILLKLKRLLYSADTLLRFRAAEATGKVSAVIARRDQGNVSKFLQGLFSSVTDTAASSWGALDAIGEIISHEPELFSQYIPRLSLLTRERALLSEILRALVRIGQVRPDLLGKASYLVITFLNDQDPQVRGYAAILLGNLGVHEAREDLKKISEDPSEIEVYKAGFLEKQTVGHLAYESLKKL
jgi:HEAT repeat protein